MIVTGLMAGSSADYAHDVERNEIIKPVMIMIILIIAIIITLFQEDNIFVTNASLTYGPRLQR